MGVSCLEVDAVVDIIFAGEEWFVFRLAGDVGWGFFFVLVEAFPVAGVALVFQPLSDGGVELVVAGGYEPSVGEGIEEYPGGSVA